MPDQRSTTERLAQLERVLDGLAENASLVGRHIDEISRLVRTQDEVTASLEDKLRCLYQLITPRFNEFFRSEAEARMGWELFKILRETPDAPFPDDRKERRRRLPVMEV